MNKKKKRIGENKRKSKENASFQSFIFACICCVDVVSKCIAADVDIDFENSPSTESCQKLHSFQPFPETICVLSMRGIYLNWKVSTATTTLRLLVMLFWNFHLDIYGCMDCGRIFHFINFTELTRALTLDLYFGILNLHYFFMNQEIHRIQ